MLTKTRIEQLQSHVNRTAEQLGCTMRQEVGLAGMMYVEYGPPYIEGPTICKTADYMVMLHELGHVKLGHTQGRPPFSDKKFYFENGVLKSEAEAWDFALGESLLTNDEFNDEELRNFMWNTCLGSYLRGAIAAKGRHGQRLMNGNRHHVAFRYDEPDEFFWGVAEELYGKFPRDLHATYRSMSVLWKRHQQKPKSLAARSAVAGAADSVRDTGSGVRPVAAHS